MLRIVAFDWGRARGVRHVLFGHVKKIQEGLGRDDLDLYTGAYAEITAFSVESLWICCDPGRIPHPKKTALPLGQRWAAPKGQPQAHNCLAVVSRQERLGYPRMISPRFGIAIEIFVDPVRRVVQ